MVSVTPVGNYFGKVTTRQQTSERAIAASSHALYDSDGGTRIRRTARTHASQGVVQGVHARILSNFDRAAPMGTGNVKAGGNYAADLLPLKE